MWAIGLLLFSALAFFAVRRLVRPMRPMHRRGVWLLIVGTLVTFPFWHLLFPSYRQFMALCDRPDRKVVLKTVVLDHLVVNGGGFTAHRYSERLGFQSFEVSEIRPALQGKTGHFRYTRGANWDTPACRSGCAATGLGEWESRCEATCYNQTPIAAPTWSYSFVMASAWLVEDRLSKTSDTALSPSGETLATAVNYLYYPYGNGWAKLLGLASGSAPTLACAVDVDVRGLEFMKPAAPR